MDSKSEDILNVELNIDIDPSILLSIEFEKLKFASELDVESILSVDSNTVVETTDVSQDSENQDLQTSTNVASVTEELTPVETELENNKDINGNEEFSPDKNLNELFLNLEISDSDNEENDEDELSKLRERGRAERRSTNSQNRTNPLDRSEKYDSSQINPRSLQFLAGSSFVQLRDTSNNFSLVNSQPTVLNTIHPFTSSDPVVTPRPVIFEDLRAVGSPESGYGSSLTGSPPPASISPNLDLIHETPSIESVDDQTIIEFLIENAAECALTDRNVPSYHTDDSDRKKEKINALVEYLKKAPNELFDSSNVVHLCGSPNEVASTNNSIDCVPLTKNGEDITAYSVALPPLLRNVETPKKLEYKLESKAKNELRGFLSRDEFYAVKDRIYRQIHEDKAKNKEIKVIQVIDEMDKMSENRTNLHDAVLKQNIEEIYCLVEIQKQYKKPLSDINIRDKYGKTALDYAIQNNMTHVVDYLKENTACQSVNV